MNIYVGNVPKETTEAELRKEFEKFGEIASITMVRDKFTSLFKGFAFIEMPKKEEAEKAIQNMDGTMLAGRPLSVNPAKPKTEFKDKPRGGYNRY